MGTARRALGVLTTLVLAAAGTTLSAGPATAAGGCTSAQLVPQLREFSVNQGLPSYGTLVAGKDTVVKLYLSLPTCAAGTKATISLAGGSTLGVTGVTAPLTALNPAAGSTAPMVAYSSAPANDATGDPKFVVAGSSLASGSVTFTATINYVAQLSGNTAPVTGTAQWTQTATVDRASNALRILFVPMGDPNVSQQLTTGGNQALQDGVQTLSRLLPLHAGTADLAATGTGAGLRYTVNNGMLDISSLMSGGKFCGVGSNFPTVQSGLAGILQAWNSNNPTAQADRVVGVVDESISNGGSAGCYEGAGAVNGHEAWVRAIYATGSPNMTGALLGMEVSHTWGASQPGPNQTATDFNGNSSYHSQNLAGDGTAPNRAYNITTRSFMNAPRSSMLVNGTWTNDTVIMEAEDFRYEECVFGGSDTSCGTAANTVGTIAAAGPELVLSGTIHVDPSTNQSFATVNDSYFTNDSQTQTNADSTSRFHVVQLKSDGTVLADDGLPVAFQPSAHGTTSPDGQDGTFYSSRPFTGADRIELRDGSQVLYSRDRNAPPVINGTSSSANIFPVAPGAISNYTATPSTNESRPALSANGLLVWSTPAGLVVSKTNDGTRQTALISGTSGATNPQFSRDSSQLAYEVSGNIDTRSVAWNGTPSGAVTFGSPSRIYSAGPLSVFPAHHPTFSPSGDRLAVEYNNNLYIVFLKPGGPLGCVLPGTVLSGSCTQVTSGGADADPAWAPAGDLIATVRSGGVSTVDAGSGQVASVVANAADPSWSGSELAFNRGGNVFLVDPSNVGATTQQLTHLGDDARPTLVWSSANGGQVAFQRQLRNPSQSDVMLQPLAPAPPTNGQTYTVTATDENPSQLRAQFLRACPDGHRHVLAAGVKPNDIDGQQARFQLSYDPNSEPSVGCAGGTVVTLVSDGASQSASTPYSSVAAGSRQPVAEITSTRPGSSYRTGQPVALQGSGYDADQNALAPSQLSWTVTGPSGTTSYAGTDHVDLTPAPGSYTVVLTATNAAGQTATAQTTFTVTGNSAPTASITSPAAGTSVTTGTAVHVAGGATDPEDGTLPASALEWGVDGPTGTQTFTHVSTFDYTPTAAGTYTITLVATDSNGSAGYATQTFVATNPVAPATVNFNPKTLNAPPLPSDSKVVTPYVSVSGQDLRQVNSSTVKISKIGPYSAANDPSFPTLVTQSWSISGSGSSQQATTKFDRIALANYLAQKGLVNQYVPITVSGSAPTWSFAGTDPSAPYVQKSN